MSRAELKLRVFANFAQELASLSTCKRRSVGCVIIPADFSRVYSIGYNGQPARISHDECCATEGSCGCIHAEMNAIAKLAVPGLITDLMMITTVSPCKLCAGLIINTQRIRQVWYLEEYRDTTGITLLAKAGLNVGVLKRGLSSSE